jgi:hypothetical protein
LKWAQLIPFTLYDSHGLLTILDKEWAQLIPCSNGFFKSLALEKA